MLGCPLAEHAAFVIRVVEKLGGVVGVTGKQLQAAEHFAADLGLDALATDLARRSGAEVVITGQARRQVADRAVFLVVAEQRQRGVDPAVQQFALQARFIVAADHRLEWHVADRAFCLRHEHIGVAGVPGPFAGQVVDEAGIGRHFA
ncbi:hypothetical protein D3C81_1733450 [compost metagenome]